MRVNKKHSATKRRHTRNWPSQSSVGSSYSATVSLSAYELVYGNSFLTENEKAFAARVETTMIKHDVSVLEFDMDRWRRTSADSILCSVTATTRSQLRVRNIYLHSHIATFDTVPPLD
jgi:hypothetical protein